MNAHTTRRGLVFASALVAAVMLLGSVAWACTTTMGSLTMTPTSGKRGTVITASAASLKKYPAKYRLVIGACHGTSIVMKDSIPTNIYGKFANVKATIPLTTTTGVKEVCALESSPVRNATATVHKTFTVLI